MSPDSDGLDRDSRIIVSVPHESGSLAKVTEVLGETGICIESIDGDLAGQLGVIILRTNDDQAALLALLEADLRAVGPGAIVLHLPDQPGALASIAQLLSEHGLNVRTIHIVHRVAGRAVIAVTTDDDDAAISLLDKDSLL